MTTDPMTSPEAYDQLAAIIQCGPTWPGNTLSHEAASECARLGWIERDGRGNWIATERGKDAAFRRWWQQRRARSLGPQGARYA